MANTLNVGTDGNWATKKNSLLGYNSENGNYKPLPFDFTRASNGTFVNKSGLIETAANGVPRIDFLGNTSGALKLEPQRTNLFLKSEPTSAEGLSIGVSYESFDWGIGFNNCVRYPNNSITYLHYGGTCLASTSYTLSYYIKMDNGEQPIYGTDFTHRIGNTLGTSPMFTNMGNGVYRVSETKISSTSNLTRNGVIKDTSFSVNGFRITALQLEEGSYPSSYIPTQGSAVTRVADACTGAGNATVFNSLEGVLYINTAALTQSGGNRWISIHDNTGNNDVELRYTSNTNQIRCKYVIGGVAIADVFFTVTDATQFSKIAFKWASSDFALWIDGVEVATSLTGATSNVAFDELSFDVSNLGSTNFYGNVKDVRVYNTALTDAELAALTTL